MNKNKYDEIYNKCIKENKKSDKDMCNDVDEKCIKIDEIFNEDMKFNDIDFKSSEDKDRKKDDCSYLEEPKIYVNCKLKVDFDTKNKIIYLYPGRSQYFTINVLKSCGDITIKYKGNYSSKGIHGNLGIYKIIESGILVETYNKLDTKKKDFLNFRAIDECTKEYYDFVVVFCCNSCGCCSHEL